MAARSRRSSGRIGGATAPCRIFCPLGTGNGRLALADQAGGSVPFHERWPLGLVDFHERGPLGLVDQVEGLVASTAAPCRIFGPLGTGDGRLALAGQAGGLVPFHERWPLGLVDFHERWPLGLVDQVEGLVAPPPPRRIFGPLCTGGGRLAPVGQAGGFVPFHERWPLGLVDQVEGLVAPPPPAEYLVSLARAVAAWLS
jgi:hypothetical protein